jgi:Domain of unknown function (DUF4333)
MPRRGYLGPGIIALAALAVIALIINFVGLAPSSPRTLSRTDAATLISQGLQAQQGGSARPQVSCPADEPVRAGMAFRCTLHHPDGSSQPIQVTETDSRGDIRFALVGSP